MCRMVARLGTPALLKELVDEPDHGLEHQSWAPRLMTSGVVNADGWGAAWYLPDEPEPAVYRATIPIWADANRFGLGRTVRSGVLLAAVRSATDPLSLGAGNTQPFVHGALTFLHNGFVGAFKPRLMRTLRRRLSEEAEARLRGDTDSEHAFALFCDHHGALDGQDPAARLAEALRRTDRDVREAAEGVGSAAILAFLVSDGRHLAYCRSGVGRPAPSLHRRRLDDGSVLVASEPLTEAPGWEAVPELAVQVEALP